MIISNIFYICSLTILHEVLSPTFISSFFAHPSGISRTPITGVIEEINFF